MVSPAELLRAYLRDSVDPNLLDPASIMVGPHDAERVKTGSVSLLDAGMPKRNPDLPLMSTRTQVRVAASDLARVDQLGRHIWQLVHGKNRLLVTQPSTGAMYLVHVMDVLTGPSTRHDPLDVWEDLMFVEMLTGTEEVVLT